MKNSKLTFKNKETGKCETINQYDINFTSEGFYFFVDGEIEAYKAAYEYRGSTSATIQFAGGVQRWMVTVVNAFSAKIGVDAAK